MRTFGLAALSCLALVVGLTGTADASTASYSADGTTLIITGGDNASHGIQFRLSADQAHDEIIDTQGFTTIPGDCTVVNPNTWISCPGHANVQVDLGAGNDDVTFTSQGFDCFTVYTFNLGDGTNTLNLSDACPTSQQDAVSITSGSGADTLTSGNQGPAAISAGAGADSVNGSPGNDVIHAGDGDDRLHGQAGNDQIFGEGGADAMRGHDGDDLLDGGPGDDDLGLCGQCAVGSNDPGGGADTYVGGPGADRLWLDSHAPGMTITINGAADDGVAGEGDNVGADIETIDGTSGNDAFTGGAGVDKFNGGAGNDIIHGGAGDDELWGDSDQDQVFGDAGADRLYGSHGDDIVDGGAGVDSMFGDQANCTSFSCPAYNDTLKARDGEVDSVQCGAGADTVEADANDVIALDGYQSCESISRSPATGPGPGPSPTPTPTPGPTPPAGGGAFSFSTVGSLTRTRGVRVKVTCPASCRIAASLVVSAATARKARLGTTIGSARATRLSAGTSTVTIRLSKKARKRLRRSGTVSATLKLAVTDGAGKTTRKQKSVRLSR